MKSVKTKTVWNNVMPNLPKKNVWYRAYDKTGNPPKEKCVHSNCRIDNDTLRI